MIEYRGLSLIFAQILFLKQALFIFFFSLFGLFVSAQTDSGVSNNFETAHVVKKRIKLPKKIIVTKPDCASLQLDYSIAISSDSLRIKDSITKALAVIDSLKKDSINKQAAIIAAKSHKDTSTYAAIMPIPFLPFNRPFFWMISKERKVDSKDELFYLIAGLIFFMAFIKLVFPKYFKNIFGIFFQTSFRQNQIREQLMQSNFASLLMNLLFVLSSGLYVTLLAWQQQLMQMSFWWLFLYCSCLLVIIYLGKYLFLSFSGWVFNVSGITNSYIFIVFLINKIIGIVLVPFILLIAFSDTYIVQVVATISLILLIVLLLYRYILSVGSIRRDLKISAFHFFLYFCTVEILPMLLIYKSLFNYIGKTY